MGAGPEDTMDKQIKEPTVPIDLIVVETEELARLLNDPIGAPRRGDVARAKGRDETTGEPS